MYGACYVIFTVRHAVKLTLESIEVPFFRASVFHQANVRSLDLIPSRFAESSTINFFVLGPLMQLTGAFDKTFAADESSSTKSHEEGDRR
jgi:hypothetical protein